MCNLKLSNSLKQTDVGSLTITIYNDNNLKESKFI